MTPVEGQDALSVTARHIALEGALNLRDLGGLPVAGGGVVRRGCVYRSAELCGLTDADHVRLGELGIGVVYDLRNDGERVARPNRLPAGIQLIERGAPSAAVERAITVEEQIASRSFPERDDVYFTGVYVDMFERLGPEIRRVLELALDSPERPLLFHCAAGKDRTGIVAAVLLGILGVAREDVVADYVLSTEHYAVHRLQALTPLLAEHGVEVDTIRFLFEVRANVLESALDQVEARWGSIDRLAVESAGVAADLPERLRARLVG